jgi:putative acetyltransferase
MNIRQEEADDLAAVHAVNEAAFETSAEADLVDALRDKVRPLVSLVAEESGSIVGHILFSPVTLSDHSEHMLMGLGPMAVLPQYQRQGIGSALVREGIERCAELGCDAVIVLGHPAYYPRFGFVPASRYGISSEYDVPDDVFMLIELKPGSLRGVSGKVSYDEAFSSV